MACLPTTTTPGADPIDELRRRPAVIRRPCRVMEGAAAYRGPAEAYHDGIGTADCCGVVDRVGAVVVVLCWVGERGEGVRGKGEGWRGVRGEG